MAESIWNVVPKSVFGLLSLVKVESAIHSSWSCVIFFEAINETSLIMSLRVLENREAAMKCCC